MGMRVNPTQVKETTMTAIDAAIAKVLQVVRVVDVALALENEARKVDDTFVGLWKAAEMVWKEVAPGEPCYCGTMYEGARSNAYLQKDYARDRVAAILRGCDDVWRKLPMEVVHSLAVFDQDWVGRWNTRSRDCGWDWIEEDHPDPDW